MRRRSLRISTARSPKGTVKSLIAGMLALAASIILSASGTALPAEPSKTGPPVNDSQKSFAGIIEQQTKQTFVLVTSYLAENANAGDAESAYRWLFETARTQGLEADAISAADAYLKLGGDNRPSRPLAQHVKCIGLARSGKLKDALAVYEEHLKSVRIRTPNDTVDLALGLAVQAQLAGDYTAAREVFDRLSMALFLNPAVRELSENRIRKLDLIDQPAPEISIEDFEGRKVAAGDLAGKVVIVDFWATNCLPCIVEFPNLKQLFAEFHPKGLEIVGISLDEDRATVTEFQKQVQLPWRLAMSLSDHDATRRRFEAAKIPSLYVIDQTGRLKYFDVHGRDLRQAVERLLGNNPSSPKGAPAP